MPSEHMVKYMDALLAVGPWAGHLTSLSLSIPICEMEIKTVRPRRFVVKMKWDDVGKAQ